MIRAVATSNPIWPLAACMLAATAAVCTGCGSQRTHSLPPEQFLSDTHQDETPQTADLSRPFVASVADTEEGEDAGLPVAAARAFAHSAGGTWVVLAPDALDPVKGFDSTSDPYSSILLGQQPSTSVTDTIARIRAAPPDPVTGLYLCGPDPQSALAALADARREKIDVDPELADTWTSYTKRSADIQSALRRAEMGSASYMELAEMMSNGQSPSVGFEFTNIRRCSEPDLMNKIAQALGGEAVQTGAGSWRISAFTQGPALDTELKRLKSMIGQSIGPDASGEDAGAGTSYEERHGEAGESITTIISDGADPESSATIQDVDTQIQQLTSAEPSVQTAENELGTIGAAAVPRLTGYLTPASQSAAACQALTILASEPKDTAGVRDAVYDYVSAIVATPAKTGLQLQRVAVLDYAVSLLMAMSEVDKAIDPQAQALLDKIAIATDLPEFLKTKARFALLRYGIIPVAPSMQPVWNPEAELQFTLTPPPAGRGPLPPLVPLAQGAIRPLASVALPNGDAWAVFASGRLGNINDLWLAHATGGVWREFLFTGKQYQTGRQDYSPSPTGPHPGGCMIAVTGDRVVISPSNSKAAAQSAAAQKAMYAAEEQSNPLIAGKLMEKYQQLQQLAGASLSTTYVLSIAALRKDSDGEGLTDLVEERFGIDPNRRVTMDNGIPDGANQNPRVRDTPPNANDSDRRDMLQQLFSALYGDDSTVDPIIIVLDTPFQQTFHGGGARVLCMTPQEYAQGASDYSALRCLQFGGPTDSDSTILRADGPCLFSDDGDRVEVHFWVVSPLQPFYGRMEQPGTDYVAIFARSAGRWKMQSMDTWRFRSSSSGGQLRDFGDD